MIEFFLSGRAAVHKKGTTMKTTPISITQATYDAIDTRLKQLDKVRKADLKQLVIERVRIVSIDKTTDRYSLRNMILALEFSRRQLAAYDAKRIEG
jgi:hypothetical protein